MIKTVLEYYHVSVLKDITITKSILIIHKMYEQNYKFK